MLEVYDIDKFVGISGKVESYILHEKLRMRKVIPAFIKCKWKDIKYLDYFAKNMTILKRRFLTIKETWVNHFPLEIKQQLK